MFVTVYEPSTLVSVAHICWLQPTMNHFCHGFCIIGFQGNAPAQSYELASDTYGGKPTCVTTRKHKNQRTKPVTFSPLRSTNLLIITHVTIYHHKSTAFCKHCHNRNDVSRGTARLRSSAAHSSFFFTKL